MRLQLTSVGIVSMLFASCAPKRPDDPPRKSHVVVAITIDWEGAYVAPESLSQLAGLRQQLGGVAFTHFVSAAYLTKEVIDPTFAPFLRDTAKSGDEIAMHLHVWTSLVGKRDVGPRTSPSFLTGNNEILQLEDPDRAFDVDLDTYDAASLRRILRTSRKLLSDAGIEVSTTFRAGGYLASPRVRTAVREEGYTIDSSAISAQALAGSQAPPLQERVKEIWPAVTVDAQPFTVDGLFELPIAAVVDYSSEQKLVDVLQAAVKRWQADPSKDVFVTIALHQETASDFVKRLSTALDSVRTHVGDAIMFTTVEKAAFLARSEK